MCYGSLILACAFVEVVVCKSHEFVVSSFGGV